MTQLGIGISHTILNFFRRRHRPVVLGETLDPDPMSMYLAEVDATHCLARMPEPVWAASMMGSTRSLSPKNSGKFYVEFYSPIDTSPEGCFVGFAQSTLTQNQAASILNMFTYVRVTSDLSYRNRLAVDIPNGKVWMSVASNGSWKNGGNPETGTLPTVGFTPNNRSFSLYALPSSDGRTGEELTSQVYVCYGNREPFMYPVPSGYTKWTRG